MKEVKEKVEELIRNFSPHVTTWDCYNDCPAPHDEIREDAARCALVCVRHILTVVSNNDLKFWKAVEKELLKELNNL